MSLHIKSVPSQEAMAAAGPKQASQWSPYVDNGGTVVGLRGKNYAIIGGDTRLSDGGYAVHSRNSTKIHKLTNHVVIASSGQQAERCMLWKVLDQKAKEYQFQNHKELPAKSVAQVLSNTLYYRRFFPIYTFNVVAGVQDGQGFVFGYDAIGSYECSPYCVTGSGSALVTSILDNQIEFKTQQRNKKDLSVDEALAVFKDAFICAGERDIYTGDSVEYAVITDEGVTFGRFELRKD